MDKEFNVPKLDPDDYITKDYEFWKDYRIVLTKIIKEKNSKNKIEKTPSNIVELAEKIGVKACARYFNIQPSQVRYYRKKLRS